MACNAIDGDGFRLTSDGLVYRLVPSRPDEFGIISSAALQCVPSSMRLQVKFGERGVVVPGATAGEVEDEHNDGTSYRSTL